MENMKFITFVVILCLSFKSSCVITNANDIQSLSFLRSFWNLDILLFWPDPNLIDPCDNISAYTGIDCNADRIIEISTSYIPINREIPFEIGDFDALESLEAVEAGLIGNIPHSISNMTNLDSIVLINNLLSGTLPNLENIFTSINLNSNNLEGPLPEVSPSIFTIFLANNNFDGEIPLSISSSRFVINMNLSNNSLTGLIPNFESTTLNFLDLSSNNFYGFLNDTFLVNDPGYFVVLNNNPFACENPSWCRNTFCRDCLPEGTNIGDELILNTLNTLWSLSWNTSVDPCNFPISYPSIVCDETNPVDKRVIELDVSNRNISAIIPNQISQLPLQFLNASMNLLFGAIPSELGNMTDLHTLNLSFNNLTGNLLNFTEQNAIEILYFQNNQISGIIPDHYGSLSNLKELVLSNNQIFGSIPNNFTSSILEILNLDHNNLSGNVPSELGNCTSLRILNLDNNMLNGSLPDQLGNPSNRFVILSNNEFTGTIPTSMEGTHLTSLNVNGNFLATDLKTTFWASEPTFTYDLRNNLWECSLPNYCSDDPGNGLCEPCVPSNSPTPNGTPNGTPPPTPLPTRSISVSVTPQPLETISPSVTPTTSATGSFTISITPSITMESATITNIPTKSSSSTISGSETMSISSTITPSPIFLFPSTSISVTKSVSPIIIDCSGTIGGNAIIDDCGICDGQNVDKDLCGICFGTNECLLVTEGLYEWDDICSTIIFNEKTDRANMSKYNYDCSKIFTDASILKMGSGSYCYWRNSCSLVICPGVFSNLFPDDSLFFLPTIHSITTGSTLVSTEVILSPIQSSTKPIALLKGPSSHARCGTIILDASFSRSTIGRDLTYKWIYLNINTDSNKVVISQINQEFQKDIPIIQLEVSNWKVGRIYKFQVLVTNFAGRSSLSNIVDILITDTLIPEIDIIGPNEIFNFSSSIDTVFQSKFRFSECTNIYHQVQYHWQVINSDTLQMVHTQQDILQPILILPANTIPPYGTYFINLHVSDDLLSSSTSITIHTQPGEICAKILKGNRVVQIGNNLILDGSESEDQMDENIPFEWEWHCYTKFISNSACIDEQIPCSTRNGDIIEFPNNEIIQISTLLLQEGTFYFTLTASKRDRSDTTTVEISIANSNTSWNAWINGPCFVNYNEPLILEGYCDDGDIDDDDDHLESYFWESTIPINTMTSTTAPTNKFLVIQPNYFSKYNTFPNTFTLTCNNEQSATYVYITPPVPNGILEITPLQGIACTDFFTFTAKNWIKSRYIGELFFQFSFLDENNKEVPLTEPYSRSNVLQIQLPSSPENRLTIILTVRDSFGIYSKQNATVIIYDIPNLIDNTSSVINSIDRMLIVNDIVTANSQLQCISHTNIDDDDISSILYLIQISLEKLCTPSTIRQNIRTILSLSQDLTSDNIDNILTILFKFERCFVDSMDETFLDTTLTLSNIFDISLNADQIHDARCFIEIMRGIRTIPNVCGEQLNDLLSDNVRIQSKIEFTQLLQQSEIVDFSFADSTSSFNFNSNILSSMTLPECIIADFAVYSKDVYNTEDEGDVISFTNSLVFRQSASEDEIPFNKLSNPIEVTLERKTQDNKDLTCVFHSNGKWDDKGLELIKIEKDFVVCQTDHLTDFSILLGANLGSDNNNSTTDLVIWILSASSIVLALCCIILILIIFLKFPTIKNMVLSAENPKAAKRREKRRVARMKRKTFQNYGIETEDSQKL